MMTALVVAVLAEVIVVRASMQAVAPGDSFEGYWVASLHRVMFSVATTFEVEATIVAEIVAIVEVVALVVTGDREDDHF